MTDHQAPRQGEMAFTSLRAANTSRQAAWCAGGDAAPDLSFRGVELAGEVGEVCNVIKKLERERHGWRGSRDTVDHLAEELADVVICADLAALSAGIDLDAAVTAKFNASSEKVGLPQRLASRATTAPVAGVSAELRAAKDEPAPSISSLIDAYRDAVSSTRHADLYGDSLHESRAREAVNAARLRLEAAIAAASGSGDAVREAVHDQA